MFPNSPSVLLMMLKTFAVLATIAIAGLTAPPSAAATGDLLEGRDICELFDGVPNSTSPLRKAKSVRRAYKTLARAKKPADFARAQTQLERAVDGVFQAATRAFHPKGRDVNRRAASAFLKRHVYTRDALVIIGVDRLEPRPEIAASLVYAACRAGNTTQAIAWARRSSGDIRGVAAALLIADGRAKEASEQLPDLGDGFISHVARAALTADATKRRAHLLAARRQAVTPAQLTAIGELLSP